jgi:thymidylate synthase (FAD)
MKIIKPSIELVGAPDYGAMLKKIERIGRICYKSEDKIKDGSAEDFIRGIIKRGHESVIEHEIISVIVTCDRGVSHEIVRHRIASYAQESTRYCNYSGDKFGKEITVIEPCFLVPGTEGYAYWKHGCEKAEEAYFDMLNWGCTPQEARDVLPTSLKTEIAMTYNLREWRHFIRLRFGFAAHPQIREVTKMIIKEFVQRYPVFFDDLVEE